MAGQTIFGKMKVDGELTIGCSPLGGVFVISTGKVYLHDGPICALSLKGGCHVTIAELAKIRHLWVFSTSHVNLLGGKANYLWAYGDSRAVVRGGAVGSLCALENSRITVWGSDFAFDGVPYEGDRVLSSYSGKRLTGILASGEKVDAIVVIAKSGNIVLEQVPVNKVPELEDEDFPPVPGI